MNTLFCCVAAKLCALLSRATAKNCRWRNDAWVLLRDKKCDHCATRLFFGFGYFCFLLFCARLLWLAGVCFIFDFLQVGRNIARRYVAAKYRLHARMADDKNNHRLQVCAKMNCIL